MGGFEGRPEGARAFRETLFLAMVGDEATHHCQKSIFVAYDFLPLREQKIIRKGLNRLDMDNADIMAAVASQPAASALGRAGD